MVLRLGYCINCREPISTDILPESKQQALAVAEREYEANRDLIRAQKGLQSSGDGGLDLGTIGDLGSFD
ncbi:hypothetical protein [Chamaesiphon sp. GL140_3_metabinner_50]|uniref:hypothetical protein n=1 Tax=Chamaesiphon sp. GL140_3_metabinner_50 TaxID=2970812 RepID=UPI00260131D9|nr:hypothetical protein [Chamaesiphon sp. GL140_3_metabinner_50]